MKVFLLALITIILISYGLYKIITGFITVPSREIDKNIQNIMNTVENMGGVLTIISSQHDAGQQLKALGSLAAFLRYPI